MSLFQVGPRTEVEQTTCPGFAPHAGTVAYADLAESAHTCPSCDCGPAACALPTDMQVSPAKCPGGDPLTPFSAPEGWEGTCTAEDAPVSGGGSLTIAAPAVLPCAVIEGPYEEPAPSEWSLMARECLVTLERGACGEGELCAPDLPPDDPLTLCLFVRAEKPWIDCPDPFPRPFFVYEDYIDHRECAPCECSAPEGAACSALVSVYEDAACGQLLGSFPVSFPEDGCFDLPEGVQLGSKDAVLTTDELGTCAPSSAGASGEIEKVGPLTLCCEAARPPSE
jgi:hypothetical protein